MTIEEVNCKFENIPALALGTWAFGSDYWADQIHGDSVKTIQAALRSGIIHFDTAPAYGKGRAEMVTGQQTRRVRDKVFIATKSLFMTGDELTRSIDISLNRLLTDHIDLFYIHWPKTGKDPRPMMEQLESERRRGRIKYIGVSNFSVNEMDIASESGHIDAVQNGYSLLYREPEKEIIPWCQKNRIPFLAYSPLGQGILTGKFPQSPKWKNGDRRGNLIFFENGVWEKLYPGIQEFKKIADHAKVSPEGLALQWIIDQPGLGAVVGARTRKQWEATQKGLEKSLPNGVLETVTSLSNDWTQYVPRAENIFRHRF